MSDLGKPTKEASATLATHTVLLSETKNSPLTQRVHSTHGNVGP